MSLLRTSTGSDELKEIHDDVKSVKKVLYSQFHVDDEAEKREAARVATLEDNYGALPSVW